MCERTLGDGTIKCSKQQGCPHQTVEDVENMGYAYLCIKLKCASCHLNLTLKTVQDVLAYDYRFDVTTIKCFNCCIKWMNPAVIKP